MNNPHWTAYITALALPAIAFIAAWIAFRQSQIARNKLKLDLYDKRMAVYQVVREALSAAATKGTFIDEFQTARRLSAPTAIKDGQIFRVGLTRLRLGSSKGERLATAAAAANATRS